MSEKKVLILGAGLMQKPAIESAKSLGWHVSVVDGNSSAMCAPLADEFMHIDLKDVDALATYALAIQQQRGLDAVFTAGTDFSASVAYIAEKTHLPSHSYEAACNATDKVRMRSCFDKANVPSPKSAEFTLQKLHALESKGSYFLSDFIHFFNDFPLVIKPVDNMGARGCKLARSYAELIDAIQTAIKYSKTGRAIVEQYMDGPEFSVDALVFEGNIIVCGFADRHIYYPPYFIEMGHTMSTEISEAQKESLLKAFQAAVHSLGLTHGAAKGDIKLTSSGPMIGEVAARLSGGYMSGWTFPYASELNLTLQALILATGKKPSVFETLENPTPESNSNLLLKQIAKKLYLVEPCYYSAERAYVSIPGIVSQIYGVKEASVIPQVKNLFERAKINDTVSFPVNNVEKCGNIITQAKTREDAIFAAEEAIRHIVIALKVPNKETEKFLSQNTDFPPSAFTLSSDDQKELTSLDSTLHIDFRKPLLVQLPSFLDKYLNNTDWNNKTLLFSLEQCEKYAPKNNLVYSVDFWSALVRGGLQGALYCVEKSTFCR